MTPKERVAAALNGQRPDKLPIMVANSNTFICQYYGMSVEQFLSDAKLCIDGNADFTREFEVDYNICVNGYILYGCGPELGCEWRFAGRDFPGFTKGPLASEADLDSIKVPEKPSGYFAHYLEVISGLSSLLGEEYHLSISILGPYAAASFLRGIQEALIDTIANPGFLNKYMKLCTKLSIYFGERILAIPGVKPILNEIFLTPEMIRPDTYHQLIAPYDRKVQEALGPKNAPNSLGAFMGTPGDRQSQINCLKLYKAFFQGVDSVEHLRSVIDLSMPGFPFPLAVSGPSLDAKPGEELVANLRPLIEFMVNDQKRYPSILLTSVQADSPEKAKEIARKIKLIQKLRDEYVL